MTRRRPAHRLTSALIGAIITAIGVLTGALLSGRELDTELIAIVALASVGGWLLVTALLSSRRPKSGAWADPAPLYAAGSRTMPGGSDNEAIPPSTSEAPLTAAARAAAGRAQRDSTKKSDSNDAS